MQLHTLQRNTPRKFAKRIGRGGKRGTTSGRGTKGQLAHGGTPRPEIRDTIKKVPKKRGYNFASIQIKPKNVSLSAIDRAFDAGEGVSPKTLLAKGLVSREGGRVPKVKVLATGDLTKKLAFSGVLFSQVAKEKVEKSGGSIA